MSVVNAVKDFFTFIVLSTINTEHGVFDRETRFCEVIETFESIKRKVPNSVIIFVDNSTEPLNKSQTEKIQQHVNICELMETNLFVNFANKIQSKGMGEAMLMDRALSILEKNPELIGDRIFKLSGRYRLAESFDIKEYYQEIHKKKYTFKINQWDVTFDGWKTRNRVVYFETRLWSFCPSLFKDYKKHLQVIFDLMVTSLGKPTCNYEIGHFLTIPHDQVYEIDVMHVEGYTADTGIYKFE